MGKTMKSYSIVLSVIFIFFIMFSVIFWRNISSMFGINTDVLKICILGVSSVVGSILTKWIMDIDVKMKHAFELTKGELKTMFSVYKHEMKSDIDAIKRSVDKLSVSVEKMNEENSKKEKIIGIFSILWDDFEQDIESDRSRNLEVDERMENSARHILGSMRDFCLWHAEQECVSKSRIDFEIKMFHDSVTQELENILGKGFVSYYSSCINNDIYQFVIGMNKIMDDKNNSKKERLMELSRVLTRKMLRLLRDCFITGKELLQEKK